MIIGLIPQEVGHEFAVRFSYFIGIDFWFIHVRHDLFIAV